jgi:hypothetical protein
MTTERRRVQSHHIDRSPLTSDLPPETDILRAGRHISKLPTAEVGGFLFDHLIGAGKYRWRDGDTKRLGGMEVDD